MSQCVILLADPKAGLTSLKDSSGTVISYAVGGYSGTGSLVDDACPGFLLLTPAEVAQLKLQPAADAAQISAINVLFGVGLSALAVIWGAKRLYVLLNTGRSES